MAVSRKQLIAKEANTAHSSAVLSLSGLVASVMGAAFAFAVTAIAGEGEATDGFFAAFSIYTVFIIFGQTMRVALVPQLGSASDESRLRANGRDRIGRLLPVTLMAGAAIAVSSPLIGEILMRNGSTTARAAAATSIAILSLAAFFQFWSATLAAVLAGARRFVASAVIYTASSAVSLAFGVVLMIGFDTQGAAIGMVAGAAFLAFAHVGFLGRFGFTAWPAPRTLPQRETWLVTGRMASSAVLPMLIQLQLTLALAAIAASVGAVTGYTYAYLAMSVLSGMTVGAISISTMPIVVEALERHGVKAAVPYVRDAATQGLFLYVPLAAGYAMLAKPLLYELFGPYLTGPTLDLFWQASLVFLLLGLTWAFFIPFTTLALAQHKYGLVATVAVAVFPLVAILILVVPSSDPLEVAAMHVVAGTLLFWALAGAILRLDALRALGATLLKAAPCVVLAAVFVPIGLLLEGRGPIAAAAGLALGGVIYLAAAYAFWPAVARPMINQLLARGAR